MRTKSIMVVGFVLIAVLSFMVAVRWFRSGDFTCEEMASSIRLNDAHLEVERWLDKNASSFDGRSHQMPIRHLFGYGSFAVPIEIDAAKFGLAHDAEAQAVVDGNAIIRAIQIVDSQGNIVVINRNSNQWYRWRKSALARVDDRTGVVCSNRD